MPKKLIALYADAYNDRFGIGISYVRFLSLFGEVMLVHSQADLQYYLETADVLALPGGADVDPRRYNESPYFDGTRTNPIYEYLDEALLIPWIATGKPIIGICRGLQTLNVAMGGSLHQHVRGHVGVGDRDEAEHVIYTDIDDLGGMDYRIYPVNSFHHQAIKRLAPDFDIIGWSPVFKNCFSLLGRGAADARVSYVWKKEKHQKNLTRVENRYIFPEIIKHRTRPYIAFQYHPEDMMCPLAISLIDNMLNPVENFNLPVNHNHILTNEL